MGGLCRALMRAALSVLAIVGLMAPLAGAQSDPHAHHHHHRQLPQAEPQPAAPSDPDAQNRGEQNHGAHNHAVGPAGSTYDLRWIDAMVQHHTGALRMSEVVFDSGAPGVGALAKDIWRDQAQEIKAMGQWRKSWYPDAPVYPVVLKAGGDPNAMADLTRMTAVQIQAMQMLGSAPTRDTRVTWFLEGMLQHHGGALIMAHDALKASSNATLVRLARNIIVAQRKEIIQLRRMLQHDGLSKPEYYQYDKLFALP